jgi:glycyl-tRNA synthetase (class II)
MDLASWTAQGILLTLECTKIRNESSLVNAQTGKAFRNEIVASIYFRMREFEQMEMQFLCVQGEMKHYEFWKEARLKWHFQV